MIFENECMNFYNGKKMYLKKSTLGGYSSILKNIIIPRLGKIKIDAINNKIIQNFSFNLLNDGYSLKYTKDITKIVIQILNELMIDEKISYFKINIKYPKNFNQKERQKKSYSVEEARKILNYCFNNINEEKKIIGIILGIKSGLRIGEICSLKYSDFDFKNNYIHINSTIQRCYNSFEKKTEILESNPKTKNSNRIIPISEDIKNIINYNNFEDNFYILTNNLKPCEPRSYRKFYVKVIKEIGLEYVNFHGLRHTFASLMITNGIDIKTVSELLGHANISTTLAIYTHSNINAKQEAIKKMDNIYE